MNSCHRRIGFSALDSSIDGSDTTSEGDTSPSIVSTAVTFTIDTAEELRNKNQQNQRDANGVRRTNTCDRHWLQRHFVWYTSCHRGFWNVWNNPYIPTLAAQFHRFTFHLRGVGERVWSHWSTRHNVDMRVTSGKGSCTMCLAVNGWTVCPSTTPSRCALASSETTKRIAGKVRVSPVRISQTRRRSAERVAEAGGLQRGLAAGRQVGNLPHIRKQIEQNRQYGVYGVSD